MFKSIILALVLGVSPFIVNAQKTMHMPKVLFYLWREPPKQYVLDEVRDIDLTLFSSEKFFSINNNGLSTFSIKKKYLKKKQIY